LAPEPVVITTLKNYQDNSTIVRINEKGKELKEKYLKWTLENSGG